MKYRNKIDSFNYQIFKNLDLTGKFNSPVIKRVDLKPTKIISFNYAKTISHPEEYYVHFYIDDYQFERVWNKPKLYTNLLKRFAGVIGPDFSPYTDLSISQRIWNIYRNKVLTAYWQKKGLNVIPNARWIDNNGLELNNGLDGIPLNSTIAITTHSALGKESYKIFEKEFDDIIYKLKPTRIVCVGKLPSKQYELCKTNNIEVLVFNSHIEKLEERRKENGKR